MEDKTSDILLQNRTAEILAPGNVEIIRDITEAIFSSPDCQSSISATADRICEYLKADHLYILIRKDDGRPDHFRHILGIDRDDSLMTASNAVIDHVIKNPETIFVPNSSNRSNFVGDPQLERFNIETVVCVPLKAGHSLCGLIYADSRSAMDWDEQTINTIEHVGNILGLVIENDRLGNEVIENSKPARTGRAMLKLSHSVKNILQMIGGAAEVVDFGLATDQIPRVKKSWGILKPNLEKLRKFTLEMLEFGREQELELHPCDFNRIVEGATDTLKPLFKQKKVKCNISLDENLPTVKLDSNKVHEMTLNTIIHALDTVEEKKGTVNIETKNNLDQNAVELIITNNGPALGDEESTNLFLPHEPGSNKFSTALGMPIAKEIIESHRGNVRIDSPDDKGTKYIIQIPTA